jgi:TonB-linked SusC/RagA family outer membrane protein
MKYYTFYKTAVPKPALLTQIIRVMRITAFLLLVTLIQVSAATYAQRLTMHQNKASLKEIFNQINLQTGYDVVWNSDQLANTSKVSANFNNVEVSEVLNKILPEQKLTYTITDKTIVISPLREPSLLDNIKAPLLAIDVHGRVVDEKGRPLPGVTIKLKDGSQVTTTDKDGNFILKRVSEKSVIIISFIGYLTKEINPATDLGTIGLETSNSKLDEVQIMAYGTTSQRLNTGDITSVTSIDIEKQPINNPLYALQGRVSGLLVTPTSGLSGSAVGLQIRGNNSLNFQTSPLIVVDGLPIVNNLTALGHLDLQQISTLSFINPNDIESINVLKDADATSIYGSRGSNGVILITTKKGKSGETRININAQNGWGDVAKKYNLLNTQQYLDYRKESYLNRNINLATQPVSLSNADLKFWDQAAYTDWQKELIGRTAKYNDVQGSISGGTSTIQYLIGGNYHRETTVFPGDNADKKGAAHMSLTGASSNQKFKATINTSYSSDNNTLPGTDYTLSALTLPPNAPKLYNQDGTLNWQPFDSGTSSWENPLANLSRSYNATINNLLASGDVSYSILPSLSAKVQLGYNLLKGNSFRKIFPFAGRPPEQADIDASAGFNETEVKNLSFEPQINYSLTFSKSTFKALLGASLQSTNNQSQEILANGFKSDEQLGSFAAADPSQFILSNTSSQYKYAAVFLRLNYNWDDKYLLNIAGRRDGSSRFGPGKQFGNFGSVGAAWIFSKENFIGPNLPILSFGKLRFSYGTSGNDGIGDYAYLERYSPIAVNDLYQGATGYATNGIFNSNYAWESTTKIEIGIDLGFFKDRVILSGNYYRNRSSNQLIGYPYPSIVGPGQAVVNLPALIQNTGLELNLTTENIKADNFSWTTTANFTINRNKLVSYPNAENSAYYQAQIGQPFYGTVQAYKFSGVDPTTGKYQFQLGNGTKAFDPSDPTDINGGRYEKIYVAPKFYGGIGNTFSYKGFSLDVFFQFTKQMGINPYSSYLIRAGRIAINVPTALLNNWKQAGDVSQFEQNGYNPLGTYLRSITNLLGSDWNYVDASFVRLKNLSLSYNIPGEWKNKAGIHSLKVYLHGQNLLTFTKYKGLDPEMQSTGTSLPQLRVITTGIQIGF